MVVESRITAVTLYARGARVRRTATIAIARGQTRARIGGLPVAVLDGTVRIEAAGAVVAAAHVGLDAPPPDTAADEEPPELRAARLRVARADAEVERIDAALAVLAASPIALHAPGAGDAEPLAAWSAVVEARRQLMRLRTERELALRDQAAAARREADEARLALAAAADRDRRAGSARPAKQHELRKHVELELEGEGEGGTVTVELEYQVAAARWSPSYVARLDGERVMFELRATVAQATGEDWTGVALRLSTAEPERFATLPELAAQRIGRHQAEAARPGFRAPPSGAAALYHDYLRSFPDHRSQPISIGRIMAEPAEAAAAGDDDMFGAAVQTDVFMAPGGPPAAAAGSAVAPPRGARPAPIPVPPSVAMPKAAMLRHRDSSSDELRRTRVMPFGATAAAASAAPPAPPAISPPPAPPAPRLDYGNLRMAPPGSPERGTLIPAPRDPRLAAAGREVAAAAARIAALALPRGHATDWPHTYDYAFATDGLVDVRADAAWHSIAVTAAAGTARLRHVAVPREQADVFRLAAIANPLPGPLLPGPIDVYDRGNFLVTSELDQTPPGATVDVGLGVDPQVKVSRNTEFREETTGVLRGGLRLHHAIKIDIDNLSDRAIDLEVRERLPVTRDAEDEIEVVVGRVEPAWDRLVPDPAWPRELRLRGGYRWRLAVPAGAQRALRAAYEVRISGKHELVGGNRRES